MFQLYLLHDQQQYMTRSSFQLLQMKTTNQVENKSIMYEKFMKSSQTKQGTVFDLTMPVLSMVQALLSYVQRGLAVLDSFLQRSPSVLQQVTLCYHPLQLCGQFVTPESDVRDALTQATSCISLSHCRFFICLPVNIKLVYYVYILVGLLWCSEDLFTL